MRIFHILIILILSRCFACGTKNNGQDIKIDWRDHWENPNERDSILSMKWVHPRVKQCLKDSEIVLLTRSFLSDTSRFNRVISLGDINSDLINDSIMIVPELFITADSSYESGTSIIFTDALIPRIRVDQVCLDVDFVFVVGDIDEDKQLEIGKYYTSCVSRLKRIELLSLKNNSWTSHGVVIFDTWFEEPPMEQRIRKIEKGKFEMREVTDSASIKIDRWITFRL
jgi:hypothetical protein